MMLIPIGISMLIQVRTEEHLDSLNRPVRREFLCMRCDICGKEWEMRGSKSRIQSRKTHTCSPKCKSDAHKNGGVIERLRAQTCLERYGAENAFAADQCRKKICQTIKNRYGFEHALQSEMLKQKMKNTMFERYGVESASKHPEIRQKQIDSMIQNFGVSYPMQLEHVKQALRDGSIKKWGVPYMMQNPEQRKIVFEKRDKNSWMSKIEKRFRVFLEERYGKENVKVQQLIEKKWCVDFRILSIDTWVSFDGVYWHGLDRPIELIRESSKRHDVAIYNKWSKDRELDEYAIENKMKLVRITDIEFKQDPLACLRKIEEF